VLSAGEPELPEHAARMAVPRNNTVAWSFIMTSFGG
jgi:hypothetical protein